MIYIQTIPNYYSEKYLYLYYLFCNCFLFSLSENYVDYGMCDSLRHHFISVATFLLPTCPDHGGQPIGQRLRPGSFNHLEAGLGCERF